MRNIFKDLKRKDHKRYLGGLDVFRYIGPGLLVTVGFIEPGNWLLTLPQVLSLVTPYYG